MKVTNLAAFVGVAVGLLQCSSAFGQYGNPSYAANPHAANPYAVNPYAAPSAAYPFSASSNAGHTAENHSAAHANSANSQRPTPPASAVYGSNPYGANSYAANGYAPILAGQNTALAASQSGGHPYATSAPLSAAYANTGQGYTGPGYARQGYARQDYARQGDAAQGYAGPGYAGQGYVGGNPAPRQTVATPRYPFHPARYTHNFPQRTGTGESSALVPPANRELISPSDQPPQAPPMTPAAPQPTLEQAGSVHQNHRHGEHAHSHGQGGHGHSGHGHSGHGLGAHGHGQPSHPRAAPGAIKSTPGLVAPGLVAPGLAAPGLAAPGCYANGYPGVPGYAPAFQVDAAYGFGAHGVAESFCEPPPPRSPWYGSYKGLYLTRDNENEVWFSYDTNDITSQTMGSLDAHMDWRFGYDIRIGKYCEDGLSSYEGVYYGMISGVSEFNAYGSQVVGNLDASLTFDSLVHDPGAGAVAVSTFFNGAERHQLLRSYEAHNVEFNHWRHCVMDKCGPSARLSWMFGLRYFNFSEGFRYRTDPNDLVFGNQSNEELSYEVDVNNHLFGFQFGGMGEFCLNECWQLNSTVKVGVFGNHIVHSSFIGTDSSAAEVDLPASPYYGERFDISSTKNDVALLAEIDLGARYRWNECWNFTGGYRAIGVTGLGLATNQVPNYFANTGGVRNVDSNGSLILHGVYYIGAEYNY